MYDLPPRRQGRGGTAVADLPPRPDTGEERGKSNRVVVRIYGEEHRLCGDAPTAYLQELAARVDGRMREIAKGNPRLSTSQVAVLAALTATDELTRLEAQHHRVLAMWEREWRKLEAAQPSAGAGAVRPRSG